MEEIIGFLVGTLIVFGLPAFLLIVILRGQGRDILRRLEVAAPNSPEVVALAVAYLRRRTRALWICISVITVLFVFAGPIACVFVFKPKPQILLSPFVDVALLIIIAMPFLWWKWHQGTMTTLRQLLEIELEPSLERQIAAVKSLRPNQNVDKRFWDMFDGKVAPPDMPQEHPQTQDGSPGQTTR
jgi:hypothetical protein